MEKERLSYNKIFIINSKKGYGYLYVDFFIADTFSSIIFVIIII